MTPLCELALKHGTDKYAKHFYTPIYYDLFKDRIETVRTVLEIGIGNTKVGMRRHAASLKMWEEFFPNAQIIGIDKKENLFINEGRIRSFYADQGNPSSLKDVASKVGAPLDIVIEDGSHRPEHQISSALTLVPFVAEGGFYVIEDIGHDRVFNEVRQRYTCEKVHTNPEHVDSVLGIIRC